MHGIHAAGVYDRFIAKYGIAIHGHARIPWRPVVACCCLKLDQSCGKSTTKTVLHHITINPAKDLKRERLIEAVHRVRLELDPSGERPFAIVIHRKTRAEVGGSKEQAHLILAGVDARGKAVDDGWTKVRTERVARELEYDQGESALLGRHHRAVLRALSRTRPEVYLWLLDAFGANPEKPQSAISPSRAISLRVKTYTCQKQKRASGRSGRLPILSTNSEGG